MDNSTSGAHAIATSHVGGSSLYTASAAQGTVTMAHVHNTGLSALRTRNRPPAIALRSMIFSFSDMKLPLDGEPGDMTTGEVWQTTIASAVAVARKLIYEPSLESKRVQASRGRYAWREAPP